MSNISRDKLTKLNFSNKNIKINITPQSVNNSKLNTCLLELNINNTIDINSKSRNIRKLLTVKTNENSKNVDNKNLTNTKDTFLSSNKLFSSNLTAAYEKKSTKEEKNYNAEKTVELEKSEPKILITTINKSCEKIIIKYLKGTTLKSFKKPNNLLTKSNNQKKNFLKDNLNLKNSVLKIKIVINRFNLVNFENLVQNEPLLNVKKYIGH